MDEQPFNNLIYGAEFPQNPVYFRVIKVGNRIDNLGLDCDVNHTYDSEGDAMFGSNMTSSLCVLMYWREEDTRTSYSQRQAALSEQIHHILKAGAQKGQVVALHAHGEGHRLQRGFLLMGCDELWCSSWMELVMVSLNTQIQSLSYVIIEPDSSSEYIKCEVIREESQSPDGDVVCPRSPGGVVVCPRPSCHPVFMEPHNSAICTSLQEAMDVLKTCTHVTGVQELLDLAEQYLKAPVCTTSHLKHPFMVIEGLDGTGKSTLTHTLARRLGAEQVHSLVLSNLRGTFDKLPPLLRRVYYAVGNYIVSQQVETKCRTSPVVMDRFWHSTVAYTTATDCAGGDESVLPPSDHWVYQWPSDLLRPSVVLLVNVTEAEREARLAGRLANTQETMTDEEAHISQNKLFMRRILAVYKNMRSPEVAVIDGDGTKEEVVDAAMRALKERDIQLPVNLKQCFLY